MLKFKLILTLFQAVLVGSFAMELPYTQVNFIHCLLEKKDYPQVRSLAGAITGTTRSGYRIHKTNYEDEWKMWMLPGVIGLAPVITFIAPGNAERSCHPPINNFIGLHILRESIISNIDLVVIAYTLMGSNINVGAINQVYAAIFY